MIGTALSTLFILFGLVGSLYLFGGIGVVLAIACMTAGALIAQAKGERPLHGAGICGLLGPLGVLLLACLSKRDRTVR